MCQITTVCRLQFSLSGSAVFDILKRMLSRFKKSLIGLGMLAVMAIIVGFVAAQRLQHYLHEPISDRLTDWQTPLQDGQYVLEPGSSAQQFASHLTAAGILKHPRLLTLYLRFSNHDQALQAGQYQFDSDMSILDMVQTLVDGQVTQYQITLVEGQTFKQWLARLAAHTDLQQTLSDLSIQQIMQSVMTTDGGVTSVNPATDHPEGQFFPDTYVFSASTTDLDILKRAYQQMQIVLQQEWQDRADQEHIKSPYEALILASIIEKETGVGHERALISGVFHNRLARNMRLQTDPTVIYGVGDAFDGDITYRHLRTDTPYNTYTRAGLPPTPIAMPGRAAIHAALHPQETRALFFVAKGENGEHVFSETLQQHERAVQAYLRKTRTR